VAWSGIGVLVGWAWPTDAARIAAVVYAAVFGGAEALMLPLLPPSSRWQVPSGWLKGRPPVRQELLWGLLLGPGFFTRNPYASFWLPILLLGVGLGPLGGAALGAAVGAAHGTARAAGVLANMRQRGDYPHLAVLGRGVGWRCRDGIFLVFAACVLAAVA
jgi:hypothetical protein